MIEFHFSKIGWIQEIKPFQLDNSNLFMLIHVDRK